MNKHRAVRVFDSLWTGFARHYALFRAKGVDWNRVRSVFRPKIRQGITEGALFDLCCEMLGLLNDNHVRLKRGERIYRSGLLGEMKNPSRGFSRELLRDRYLVGKHREQMGGMFFCGKPSRKLDSVFFYGRLAGNVGYVHFDRFHLRSESIASFHKAMLELGDCGAFVVDVRNNRGGDDLLGMWMADYFADQNLPYMITRTKFGPGPEDFAAPRIWCVENQRSPSSGKPAALLTDRSSVSAAENFALAFKAMQNAVVVGDVTSGCFADCFWDRLPNGWEFSVSFKLFTDADGFCYEGLGVPPDYRVVNTARDIREGHDRVLETALDILKCGPGITRPRTPRPFRRSRDLSWEDLLETMRGRVEAGEPDRALEAAVPLRKKYADIWQISLWSAKALLQQGKGEAAIKELRKALELNNGFFPWDREARKLIKGWLMKGWTKNTQRQLEGWMPRFLV